MNNYKNPLFTRRLQFHNQVNNLLFSVQNFQRLKHNYNHEKLKMKKMKNIFLQIMKMTQILIMTIKKYRNNNKKIKYIMTIMKFNKMQTLNNYQILKLKKIKIKNKNMIKWKQKAKKLKPAEIIYLNCLRKRKKQMIMKQKMKMELIFLQIFLKACILNQILSKQKK